MESIFFIIHLVLAIAIIGLVLLQRSEGGGLGMGGGGGMGGLTTAQGTASFLTRATAICAICFFITSLTLGILAGTHTNQESLMDQLDQRVGIAKQAATTDVVVKENPIVEENAAREAEEEENTEGDVDTTVPSAPVAE